MARVASMRSSTCDVTKAASAPARRPAASRCGSRRTARSRPGPASTSRCRRWRGPCAGRLSAVLSVDPDSEVSGSMPNSTAPATKPTTATMATASDDEDDDAMMSFADQQPGARHRPGQQVAQRAGLGLAGDRVAGDHGHGDGQEHGRIRASAAAGNSSAVVEHLAQQRRALRRARGRCRSPAGRCRRRRAGRRGAAMVTQVRGRRTSLASSTPIIEPSSTVAGRPRQASSTGGATAAPATAAAALDRPARRPCSPRNTSSSVGRSRASSRDAGPG